MTQFLSIQSQLSAILKVQSVMPMGQQKQHTALPVDDQWVTLGIPDAASMVVNKNLNTVPMQPWPSDASTQLPLQSTMYSSATDNDDYVSQDNTPLREARRRRNEKRLCHRSEGNQHPELQGLINMLNKLSSQTSNHQTLNWHASKSLWFSVNQLTPLSILMRVNSWLQSQRVQESRNLYTTSTTFMVVYQWMIHVCSLLISEGQILLRNKNTKAPSWVLYQ